eukprot:31765-Amphidinium_carterae.2
MRLRLGLDGNGAVDGHSSAPAPAPPDGHSRAPSPAPPACSGQLKPPREQNRANSAHSLTSEAHRVESKKK